jgi:hypothetical protein
MRRSAPAILLASASAASIFLSLGFLAACGGGSSSTPPGQTGDVITAVKGTTPQSEQVGQAFQLLQVNVTNSGSPVGNVTVTFTAPSKGASGTFVNGTVADTETTNSSGIATATTFKANTIAGSYSVTASATGATSGTFSLSNTAGAAAKITTTAGSNQSAAAGSNFASALQATVVDSDSNPVSDAVVTFTAPSMGTSGTFAASGSSAAGSTATATTNASGVATAPAFTAGGLLGSYTVAATVSGVTTSANFTLTNLTGAAAIIAASSGSPQYATIGTAFLKTLQATVTDNFSNPISGATVVFTAVPAAGASGTFADGTATDTETTDATGLAVSTTFTANSVVGCYTATATTSGVSSPASFGLNGLNNVVPAVAPVGGTTPQSATVNTGFATDLQASVTANACGTTVPLTGVTVTFTAPATGASGTFAGTDSNTSTAVTNATGVAEASLFTANNSSGSYSVTASAPSATSTATFSLKNTAVTSLAAGNYVFSLSGYNTLGYPFSLAGVFSVSGGAVTAGELDFVDYLYADTDNINPAASSISQSSTTNNFVITLATCNASDCTDTDDNVGVNGVITLDAALLPSNSQKALVTEFDSSASGSGTLDFQTSKSVAGPGYAFGLNGLDTLGNPIAIGGVLDVGQCTGGTVPVPGSIFDANDDASGTTFAEQTFSSCTVSGADSLGRIEVTLNQTDSADFPQMILAGYVVDANDIRLVETDDDYLGDLGGTAFNQGSTNTGSFSSSSVSGTNYVVGLTGSVPMGILQTAALLTFNSNGTVSGYINYNDLTGTGSQPALSITGGTYTVDDPTSGDADAGTGRVTLAGVTDGTVTFNLELYLDGNGRATAISMDQVATGSLGDTVGGLGYQQTGGPFRASMFTGGYALNATGWDKNLRGEFDSIGPITAMGSSDTFSGTFDLNWLTSAPVETPGLSVSGTYVTNTDGVFTGTITGPDLTTPTNADVFNYYLIDGSGDSIAIETDTNQLTLGYFLEQ